MRFPDAEGIELLAERGSWPEGEIRIITERVQRRWRRCVLTATDVPEIARALMEVADRELLHRAWDNSTPCRVVIEADGTTIRLRGPRAVEDKSGVPQEDGSENWEAYDPSWNPWDETTAAKDEFAAEITKALDAVPDPSRISEVTLVFGDNLSLVAALTFRRRGPGARIIVLGYAETVPYYGAVAHDFVRATTRLLKGRTKRSLWLLLVPPFIAPRFEIRRPGEPSRWRDHIVVRALAWLTFATATAVIGLIVAGVYGSLFG